MPTVLDLTGAKKPAAVKSFAVPAAPGRSLAPAFAKDVTVARDYLWWQHEDNRAIRAGDWKLVALKGGAWELYDLSTDRGESQNLAAKNPAKARELEALWTQHREETRKLALTDPPPADAAGAGAKKGKRAKQP